MWNKKRSLALSKLCVILFSVTLLVVLCTAPWLIATLQKFSNNAAQASYWFFLASIYTGAVPAAVLLYALYRLLSHIGQDEIFTNENVKYLRNISWCCFIGGGVCLVSFFYYVPWLVAAISAGFVGLIVRVVKNIIAQAVLLKQENDYTI